MGHLHQIIGVLNNGLVYRVGKVWANKMGRVVPDTWRGREDVENHIKDAVEAQTSQPSIVVVDPPVSNA